MPYDFNSPYVMDKNRRWQTALPQTSNWYDPMTPAYARRPQQPDKYGNEDALLASPASMAAQPDTMPYGVQGTDTTGYAMAQPHRAGGYISSQRETQPSGGGLSSYDYYINLRNQQNAQPQQNMYSSPYDMFGQMAQKAAEMRKQSMAGYYQNQLNDAQNKAFWANKKRDMEIRGNFANLSKQGLADIGQRYDSERGRIAQEAVSRGLTGTTIPGAQRLASTRSQTAAENNWRDQQAQQLNQYLASINNNYQNPNAVYQTFQNYGYGG